MSRLLITSFIVSLLVFALPQDDSKGIESVWDREKDITTVRLRSTQISGPKDRYHSLAFSIYYSFPTKWPAPPHLVNFELVSVVKARKLNTDLYVMFVVDGKEIHFSSKRSAIPRPVRGKPWIGERMVFLIPFEQFQRMSFARTLSVKLGGVTFDFDEEMHQAIKRMERNMAYRATN